METGLAPGNEIGDPEAWVKFMPFPLPSMTLIVLSVWFVTAKSILPSPLKSPATTEDGPLPTVIGDTWETVVPLLRRISTTPAPKSEVPATARSGIPSPLKSPMARAVGVVLVVVGCLPRVVKVGNPYTIWQI